jgi:hypothetical protein
MLSAPATIPATSAGTFTAGKAPPRTPTCTLLATKSGRPARRANSITGASPAHDTRFGSSNATDTLEIL